MSSRETVLARVRAALTDVDASEPPAWEPPISSAERHAGAGLTDLFAERCADYRATVTRCADDPEAIAVAIASACARHDAHELIAPADLPQWTAPQIQLHSDGPSLSPAELESHHGVLTASALAIAETGTIVLDCGPAQGRRALTLVPDLHICVVRADQIVAGVPEAISALAGAVAAGRPVTFISGPSATSDIELKRVEGVHGPRRLEVVLGG